MTRDDVCTCAQYSQCPVCNKSRSNYNELMLEHDELKAENERLQEALDIWKERYEDAEEYVHMLASAMDSWLHPDGSQPEEVTP